MAPTITERSRRFAISVVRNGARNDMSVTDAAGTVTTVSLSEVGRNREARRWLQEVLFPDKPLPRVLRDEQDRSAGTRKRKRRKGAKRNRRSS